MAKIPDDITFITKDELGTLFSIIMVLLERQGGQATINLEEANATFRDYRLGIANGGSLVACALVTVDRAEQLRAAGTEMDFLN